ncbi:MAG: Na/Pi cotransporter family protein [Erysipelotrichaceae bacterium]|nr:Na/Pi cotransporter family protein [Erysipelotrichaceae bacterium]
MDIFNVLNMIGGLSLFLYGMHLMGEALSKMAGGKLESVLEKLTSKPIFAVLLGAGVTAVIQSSSATTVMVVGFVNSGIMKLGQAAGIIMGANIGTTVTSWLLSLTGISGSSLFVKMLKPSSFSPILAAIGIVLLLFSKGENKKKDIGEILIGFAVLMFGMDTMSKSVAGLANNAGFTGLMTAFSNPLLGMSVGALLTAIIQSSSASVGILQALCLTGAVKYSTALPIIMGQNIGTCVTSIISSFGANKNAKRAAMVHLYFNLIGTVVFMAVFYTANLFIDFAFLKTAINPAGIAVVHSLFNIGTTILLFPFSKQLVKFAELTIPEDKNVESVIDTISIDERFLESPGFAMELCRNKAREMAELTNKAIKKAGDLLLNYDEKAVKEIIEMEGIADRYEDVLGSYLVKLSSKNLSVADSRSMSIILHSISDFERISDHAMEIALNVESMKQKNLNFSEYAYKEIEVLVQATNDICNITLESFSKYDDNLAIHVEPFEEVIDTLTKKVKENHIRRLRKGQCTIEIGFILENILNGLERVSDHCSNIAIELITITDNDYNTHEYYKNISNEEKAKFDNEYRELLNVYAPKLSDDMITL